MPYIIAYGFLIKNVNAIVCNSLIHIKINRNMLKLSMAKSSNIAMLKWDKVSWCLEVKCIESEP